MTPAGPALTARRGRPVLRGCLVVLACLVVTGCTPQDGRTYPNAVDVERATRMWTDPWLAPTDTRTATRKGVAPRVERTVGARSYRTAALPRDVVTREVRAALSRGWVLTGATCDQAATPGGVAASLRLGAADPGSAAVARVTATATGAPAGAAGAPTGSAGPSGPAGTPVEVVVAASVPHHLDAVWPAPGAVTPEQTCLGSASGTPARADLPDTPMTGSGSGRATDLAGWREDGVPEGLRAAASAAGGDGVLATLGVSLSQPAWDDGVAPRSLPAGTSEPRPVTPAALDEAVDGARSKGWTLTFAACQPAPGPRLAELHRTLEGGYSAALRLTLVPEPGGAGRATLTAAAVVTSPTWWGPRPGALPAVTDPCREPVSGRSIERAISVAGAPRFGPTMVWPLQPGG